MSVKKIYEEMKMKLGNVVPDLELKYKAELVAKINQLKKEKNVVILGHNYMAPEIYHFVADFGGDSLELARKAAETDKDIILFCGVKFMAETAKILSPDKKVLIPSLEAGCSLAESITGEDIRKLKKQYPGVPVVTYVNTYADAKMETDVCCTSSNAVKVVNSLKTDTVIFLPDEYLAGNVARETNKKIINWTGRCEVHEKYSVQDIDDIRKQFSEVVVLAHPECRPDVVKAADFAGSTAAMIKYVEKHDAPCYLILTECMMGDNIAAANPQKNILRLCSVRCPHMNKITLENTLEALQKEQYEVNLSKEICEKAAQAVKKMIEIG
jgi:quinolinate synthase